MSISQADNKQVRKKATQLMNWAHPVHWLAVGFGSGLSPRAPGTFGTLAAIPFFLFMQELPELQYALIVAVSFVVGCWICGKTSRDWGVHDHGAIVWDEFVGLWVTLFMLPPGWYWLLAGFLLFRFFDILKPWPIKVLDKNLHHGLGIMLDDLLAGVFSLVLLQATYYGLQLIWQ